MFFDRFNIFAAKIQRKNEMTKYNWKIFQFVCELPGHLHNHVGLTENFDQSENEEFLVNDSP